MRKVIFLLFCFFFGINFSFALTMDCPNVVSPGDEFKISLTDNNFNGLKAKFDFDSGFSYNGINMNKNFKTYYDSQKGFSVGNVNIKNEFKLDINVKVGNEININKDYTLGVINIEASDKNYKYVHLDDVSCKIKVLSDINTLQSLNVEGVKLSPKFSSNILSYSGVTKNNKITIKAIASDMYAKVEGDIGEQKLKIGVNTFVIKVTSAKGSVREYKIYITRESKSNDVTLKSLKLSSGKLDFKKNIFLYAVDVNNDVETIEVVAIPTSSNARVVVNKTDALVVGENVINIVVTAEDGSFATYVVVVNRKEKLSNDATIKSLIVKGYELDFKSDIFQYELDINEESNLDIEVILNDDKAKYDIIGNDNLKNNSVIEIEVTAEDGSIKVYKICCKKNIEQNSSSVLNYIGVIPIIDFILLILVILSLKIIKGKYVKFHK